MVTESEVIIEKRQLQIYERTLGRYTANFLAYLNKEGDCKTELYKNVNSMMAR